MFFFNNLLQIKIRIWLTLVVEFGRNIIFSTMSDILSCERQSAEMNFNYSGF